VLLVLVLPDVKMPPELVLDDEVKIPPVLDEDDVRPPLPVLEEDVKIPPVLDEDEGRLPPWPAPPAPEVKMPPLPVLEEDVKIPPVLDEDDGRLPPAPAPPFPELDVKIPLLDDDGRLPPWPAPPAPEVKIPPLPELEEELKIPPVLEEEARAPPAPVVKIPPVLEELEEEARAPPAPVVKMPPAVPALVVVEVEELKPRIGTRLPFAPGFPAVSISGLEFTPSAPGSPPEQAPASTVTDVTAQRYANLVRVISIPRWGAVWSGSGRLSRDGTVIVARASSRASSRCPDTQSARGDARDGFGLSTLHHAIEIRSRGGGDIHSSSVGVTGSRAPRGRRAWRIAPRKLNLPVTWLSYFPPGGAGFW
jgi:hypothetical protein